MDPVNQWSFNEGDDSLITINHTISARGFKTSNSAITNAKNFVQGLQGTSTFSAVTPQFIGGLSVSNLVLKGSGVSINRLDSTYEITEDYVAQTGTIMDIAAIPGVTSSFSADLSSGAADDYLSVNVDYTLQGGKDITDSDLRSKLPRSQRYILLPLGQLI